MIVTCLSPARSSAGSRLPIGMRYRALKKVYKNYVGVFKSNLHGLGLFCIKEIDAGQMVIEYSGQLIRRSLADPRERYYESRVSEPGMSWRWVGRRWSV